MAELSTQEKGVIASFKAKARDFWALWQNLDQKQAIVARQDPKIQKQYADLMDRGLTIRGTIENITSIIDTAAAAYESVKNWLSEQFGLSGYELDRRTNRQLGVLPLIPIAVVVAGVAAIGKWTSDAYQLDRRLTEIQRLEARGIPSQEAAEIVSQTMPSGIFGDAGKLVLPLVLGGAALLLIPQLMKK